MKTLKYIAILGALSLPLVGCSDFLEEDNKSTNNENGNAYIEKNPDVLRATAYNSLKSFVTDINLQDLSTDLFSNLRSANNGTYSLFSFSAIDSDFENYYKNAYAAINYANAMIKYGDSKLAAEGRYLRGLCYYYLTQQFGAVPYVTDYIMSSKRDYPRTDLAEIYSSVINDLTEVYNSNALPATDHTGYVSNQAVAALLAQLYLAYGWDIDTSLVNAEQGTYTKNSTANFTQAASWAEKAINGTALTMSFEDKWSPFNQNNNEVIFQVNWLRDGFPGDESDGGHSLQNMYCSHVGNSTNTGQKGNGSGGQNQLSNKAMYLWGPGDTRWDGTFMTLCYNSTIKDGVSGWGDDGYYAYYNLSAAQLANHNVALRYFPYYATEADLTAFAAEMGNRFSVDATHGVETPFAVIMTVPNATVLTAGTSAPAPVLWDSYVQRNFDCPAVKKFDDPASSPAVKSNDYRNVVLSHVSQMYLVAAEAYYMAGQESQALDKINAVRTRAGAGTTDFGSYPATVEYPVNVGVNFTVGPIDLILDELARETYAERTRFADLRRTKQLVRYNLAFSRDITNVSQMEGGTDNQIKWYRPIPQAEIDANTAISMSDQNPGYGGSSENEEVAPEE